ncbi:MAG: bifunctional cytidylyltransferase/SDR family oxidoreductase [Propionibacteriaceae bacterium]|jgi:2-C-methyl-D-erythritol 4-phosphate cytidylyltransferase|nr:bifunctional cytidylyltransferase/SDR family oxidoreductase [Propionibacteriaceae bacterium]
MKTYGVVLAGGVGARLGLSVPKQMIKVAGKTILEHTVALMDRSPHIDELIVMIAPGWSEQVATLLGDRYPKLSRILEGGSTRNETTRRVLDAIAEDECKIILHDAVRPLLDQRIIADCASTLDNYAAVDVVIPSADTIVAVDDEDIITTMPQRSHVRRGQTPQAFRISVLRSAYEKAVDDPYFSATDDCGVVLKYRPDVKIKCVLGAEHNIKVTYPVDLFIADKLFQLASQDAPHKSPDELKDALQGKTVVIFGGSYGIGAEIGRLAGGAGMNVVAHGRSTTGVHVEDETAIAKALAKAAKQFGGIDAVVVTAGVLKIGKLAEADDKTVAESIRVNYVAPVNVARAAHQYLKASGGHLMFFTSSSYTRGREDYALYSSSKAAVVNLTQALSEEWASEGIKVNVVNPERTSTPMRFQAFGEEPEGTLLPAEQVAQAALETIASDLTGLVVDVRRKG